MSARITRAIRSHDLGILTAYILTWSAAMFLEGLAKYDAIICLTTFFGGTLLLAGFCQMFMHIGDQFI